MKSVDFHCLQDAPRMYIPSGVAVSWIGNFVRQKHRFLSLISSKTELLQFETGITEFKELLENIVAISGQDGGVRIYFACYKSIGTTDNTVGENEDLLTTIFAPTRKSENRQVDSGDYFGFDANSNVIPIIGSTAATWVANYREPTGKWEKLSERINKEETKSIFYSADSLIEFIDELKCFIEHTSASKVSVFFGAYEEGHLIPYFDEIGRRRTYNVGNQLCLVFTVVDEESEPFRVKAFEGSTDYDTGTPCPPGSNCLGSSLE